jgi:Superfamily II DNA helicase
MEIDKMNYFKDCVLELFNFSDLERIMRLLKGFIMDNLSTLYPSLYEKWKYGYTQAGGEIFDVALKFEKQINNFIGEDYIDNKFLRERCLKGGEYFSEKMISYIAPLLPSLVRVELDNKLNAKKLKDLYKNFVEYAFLKIKLIEHFSKKEFELEEYLKTKAKIIVDMGELRITKKGVKNLVSTNSNKEKSEEKEKTTTHEDTPDILNKELFNKLRSWRYQKAKAAGLPAYCVLGQKGLIGICNNPPKTEAELLAIKGIGKIFTKKYGAEILQLTCL